MTPHQFDLLSRIDQEGPIPFDPVGMFLKSRSHKRDGLDGTIVRSCLHRDLIRIYVDGVVEIHVGDGRMRTVPDVRVNMTAHGRQALIDDLARQRRVMIELLEEEFIEE